MAEKTEKPTPQKIRKSREQGDIPKSQEMAKLIIFSFVVGVISLFNAQFISYIMHLLETLFIIVEKMNFMTISGVPEQILKSSLTFLMLAAAFMIFVNMLAYWLQFGPAITVKSAMPKLSAISPVKNVKSFFTMQKLWLIIITLLKCMLLLFILINHIKDDINIIVSSITFASASTLSMGLQSMMIFIWKITLIFIVFAAADFIVQKRIYLKKQKMSMEEVKKEHKDNDGDPLVKGIRRSIAMSLLQSPPPSRPPPAPEKANMILVNPLHYAVALYYQPDVTPLPQVLYKVRAYEARKYCKQAKKEGKSIVENIWLTRRIFYTTEIGDFIPLETINQVARIYRNHPPNPQ